MHSVQWLSVSIPLQFARIRNLHQLSADMEKMPLERCCDLDVHARELYSTDNLESLQIMQGPPLHEA